MFKPQFAPLVKAGTKRQTIRPMPKRLPKPGDVESWRQWSELPYRSPQIELARVRIVSVEVIIITETDIFVIGRKLTYENCVWLSRNDGFIDFVDLRTWFKREHGLPFTGILIFAEDLKSENPCYKPGTCHCPACWLERQQ